MSQYDTLSRYIATAPCYDSLTQPIDSAIIAFDEPVRLEDQMTHRFLAMIRASDDAMFASLIRRIRDARPRWMKSSMLDAVVREELDMRLLVAKVRPLDRVDKT